MNKFAAFLFVFAFYAFNANAQTPGSQPEICVTSPSQTFSYNQLCISASSSGGVVNLQNFGSSSGGLTLTQNGQPIGSSGLCSNMPRFACMYTDKNMNEGPARALAYTGRPAVVSGCLI